MEGRPRDTLQYKPDLECKKVLKKIDMARKSKNLSIHRLAEKAGIASSTLNEMLHGKTAPQRKNKQQTDEIPTKLSENRYGKIDNIVLL